MYHCLGAGEALHDSINILSHVTPSLETHTGIRLTASLLLPFTHLNSCQDSNEFLRCSDVCVIYERPVFALCWDSSGVIYGRWLQHLYIRVYIHKNNQLKLIRVRSPKWGWSKEHKICRWARCGQRLWKETLAKTVNRFSSQRNLHIQAPGPERT